MLGPGVIVEAGAVIEDSVIMNDVVIGKGAKVTYSILDANVTIGKDALVGEYKMSASDIAVVGADVKVAAGSVVPAGAMLSEQ